MFIDMKAQFGNIYYAISHPERRRILEALMLADSPAMELSRRLSPSALSQHLTVLKKAKLVRERREGRQRIYSITPAPLLEPFDWLSQYQAMWNQKLNKLGEYLQRRHG